MRINKEMVNDLAKLQSLTNSQIEFVKLLEGTDLPISLITVLVGVAKDSSIEEMKTILRKKNIFVKAIFLEDHPEFAEEMKGL